jgi:hypothetical protein
VRSRASCLLASAEGVPTHSHLDSVMVVNTNAFESPLISPLAHLKRHGQLDMSGRSNQQHGDLVLELSHTHTHTHTHTYTHTHTHAHTHTPLLIGQCSMTGGDTLPTSRVRISKDAERHVTCMGHVVYRRVNIDIFHFREFTPRARAC